MRWFQGASCIRFCIRSRPATLTLSAPAPGPGATPRCRLAGVQRRQTRSGQHSLTSPLFSGRWRTGVPAVAGTVICSPQPLHPFHVHVPPVRHQQRMDPPAPEPGTPVRDLAHRGEQLLLESRSAPASTAGSSDAAPPPGTPAAARLELADQTSHGCPAPSRAHQFPFCRSFNMLMSRACSATIRFNREFSASSAFNRWASSSFNAPYSIRHR